MSTELITAPASGFALLLSPTTLQETRAFAEMLAKSDLVPKAYQGKPGDIMVAGAMGARLGLDIFSALAGVACVNGRPTLYGDAMLGICQSRSDFEDIIEEVKGIGDAMAATVTVKRKGRSPYTTTYSMADAATAGLKGKQGPWMQHPKRMLTMRARAFALRGAFADALAGFHAREEFDELEDVTSSATVVPEAKAAKVRKINEKVIEAGEEAKADLAKNPNDKVAQKVVDAGEEAKRENAEPIVITDLDKPATAADLVAMCQNVAKEFGQGGIDAIKGLNVHFGVKKIGEIPAERIEEAVKMLIDATGKLADAQGRDGGK